MVAPHRLEALITGTHAQHIVIDEVQKIPKLLDEVHRLIEKPDNKRHFILTSSSSKKLKAGGANLLAGRAFLRNLFALSQTEIGASFVLEEALRWGTLPKLYALHTDDFKRDYLDSYAQLYHKIILY
jgi:predicted AAA+ superfamily ATPase